MITLTPTPSASGRSEPKLLLFLLQEKDQLLILLLADKKHQGSHQSRNVVAIWGDLGTFGQCPNLSNISRMMASLITTTSASGS